MGFTMNGRNRTDKTRNNNSLRRVRLVTARTAGKNPSVDGTYDVVVVGGGIAGLAAAWGLRDRDLLLLEASDRLGGRIHSERRGDYWLNFGAHVFGPPASASGRLLSAAG